MVLDSVSLIFSLTSTASVRTKMGMAKRMDKASYEVVWPVSHAHIAWNRCLITMGINQFEQPTLPVIVVNFVLFKALPDPEPILVQSENPNK